MGWCGVVKCAADFTWLLRDGFIHAGDYAVVTPLRKAASYEPRIAILGTWGHDSFTWLTRGKYGIYVAVRGSYGALTGSTWRLLEILPRKISTFYCRVSYVTVARIPSLVLRNTWHYVIIRRRKFWFPKFVLRCSYEAALRKGVTTALYRGITAAAKHDLSSFLISSEVVVIFPKFPGYTLIISGVGGAPDSPFRLE